jgi:chorismate mutase
LKAEAKIQASDHGRELAQIEKLRKLSADANLDADFAEKILTLIISEVVRKHEEIRSNRY